jgi:membrane protein
MVVFFRQLRRAVVQSFQYDVLDTSKSVAYSGMLMLFPAVLLATTIVALMPAGNTLLDQAKTASDQFLPADTMSLLQSYFLTRRASSLQVMLSAFSVSAFGAFGVTLSLMEGFRRAYRLPRDAWGFWKTRIRALLLVPIALIPLSLASLVVIFGQPIENWMNETSLHPGQWILLLIWRLVRWTFALVTSATVVGAVFHFGTHSKEHWRCVAPGAITASILWFPVTLGFGLYVTRVADYTVLYGSLGTAIATLVWLYLTSYSILLGAEINGVRYRERQERLQQAQLQQATSAPWPGATNAASPQLGPTVETH